MYRRGMPRLYLRDIPELAAQKRTPCSLLNICFVGLWLAISRLCLRHSVCMRRKKLYCYGQGYR